MALSILLLHRYLGIGLGLLMVLWCLSGVVMMYVSYPALDESARLAHLQPIAWAGCCRLSDPSLARLDASGAELEMLGGRPVLFQWDALMLLLMGGVTLSCTTGAYLGFRRLTLRARNP